MKACGFLPLLSAFLLIGASAFARNPFLSAKSDAPISAKFTGVEWNDEFEKEEYPWSARVTTQRVATAPWGAFFKITFDRIATQAPHPREMRPLYFFTTDNEIVLLNEADPQEAIARLAAGKLPPKFEPRDIYGLSKGARQIAEDRLSAAKLAVKGDRSTYEGTHNSGHFTRVTWQRGRGLVEYAQGQGAHQDGFSLKH